MLGFWTPADVSSSFNDVLLLGFDMDRVVGQT